MRRVHLLVGCVVAGALGSAPFADAAPEKPLLVAFGPSFGRLSSDGPRLIESTARRTVVTNVRTSERTRAVTPEGCWAPPVGGGGLLLWSCASGAAVTSTTGRELARLDSRCLPPACGPATGSTGWTAIGRRVVRGEVRTRGGNQPFFVDRRTDDPVSLARAETSRRLVADLDTGRVRTLCRGVRKPLVADVDAIGDDFDGVGPLDVYGRMGAARDTRRGRPARIELMRCGRRPEIVLQGTAGSGLPVLSRRWVAWTTARGGRPQVRIRAVSGGPIRTIVPPRSPRELVRADGRLFVRSGTSTYEVR